MSGRDNWGMMSRISSSGHEKFIADMQKDRNSLCAS